MLQRHDLEVDHLDKGPDHVVGRQGLAVAAVDLLGGGGALEDGHAAEEDADEGWGEDALVEGDAGEDGAVCGFEVYVALEEFEPGCCGGAEDDFWGRGGLVGGCGCGCFCLLGFGQGMSR